MSLKPLQPSPAQIELRQRLQAVLTLNSAFVVEVGGLGSQAWSQEKKDGLFRFGWETGAILYDQSAVSPFPVRFVYLKREAAEQACAMDGHAQTLHNLEHGGGSYKLTVRILEAPPAQWAREDSLLVANERRFFFNPTLDPFSPSFSPHAILSSSDEIDTAWSTLADTLPLPFIGLYNDADIGHPCCMTVPGLSPEETNKLLASLLPLPPEPAVDGAVGLDEDGDVQLGEGDVTLVDDDDLGGGMDLEIQPVEEDGHGTKLALDMARRRDVGVQVDLPAEERSSILSGDVMGPRTVEPEQEQGAEDCSGGTSGGGQVVVDLLGTVSDSERHLLPLISHPPSSSKRKRGYIVLMVENVPSYMLEGRQDGWERLIPLLPRPCFAGKPRFLIRTDAMILTYASDSPREAMKAMDRISKWTNGITARIFDPVGQIQVRVRWKYGGTYNEDDLRLFIEMARKRSGWTPEAAIAFKGEMLFLYASEFAVRAVVATMARNFPLGRAPWDVEVEEKPYDFCLRLEVEGRA